MKTELRSTDSIQVLTRVSLNTTTTTTTTAAATATATTTIGNGTDAVGRGASSALYWYASLRFTSTHTMRFNNTNEIQATVGKVLMNSSISRAAVARAGASIRRLMLHPSRDCTFQGQFQDAGRSSRGD